MARTESRTKTSIWTDEDFKVLTSRAQRMYWLLYSQSTISLCGVLAMTARRWAATAPDETLETVHQALGELEEHNFILVDRDTEEVFVRTFVRHDGVARSPKTCEAAWKQLNNIDSPVIQQAAVAEFTAIGHPPPSYEPPHRVSGGWISAGNQPPDTHRERARAVSSLQSPSPDSSLPAPASPIPKTTKAAVSAGRDVVLRTEPADQAKTVELAHRIADLCTGDNQAYIRNEAAEVVCWALETVDARIIEEAITWAEQKPPTLPRGVAALIKAKADDHRIRMPAFQTKVAVS